MNTRAVLPLPILAAALLVAGCTGSSETPVSPTIAPPQSIGANADGSTLKVTAPASLSPSGGGIIDSNRVTLAFEPSAGRHVAVAGLQHRVELYQNQTRIAEWVTPAATVVTGDLDYTQAYSWRVQATMDGESGPWSDLATFITPAPPTPPECLAQPIEANRLPCILAVAARSDEWPRCEAGSGSACHRFTREVARALAIGDGNWGLLGKAPGTWQCSLTACGTGIVGGLGEDVIVYCTGGSCRNPSGPDGRTDWVAIDIVLAAGLPGAQLHWGPVPRVFNRGNNFWVSAL